MAATVDALLPLSLLEAVRNVDTPADSFEAEYVEELRNKRLGLSDTIYAQIKRHSEAAKRGQRTGQDESVALAKLIGRRPDAEAVFRAAGRYMARQSYRTISPVTGDTNEPLARIRKSLPDGCVFARMASSKRSYPNTR